MPQAPNNIAQRLHTQRTHFLPHKGGLKLDAHPPYLRSDIVGSLLRPDDLMHMRTLFERGEASEEALAACEDQAILGALDLQRRAGLDVVTDGEFRRTVFFDHLVRSVAGLQPTDPSGVPAFSYRWRGPKAEPQSRALQLACVNKLSRTAHLSADEFRFVKAHAGATLPKITLPAPSFFSRYWHPRKSLGAYPTLESYLADLIDIVRAEVSELIELGATYIQFDAPNYGLILDPIYRSAQQRPLRHLLAEWAAVDNSVIERFPQTTFALHICRGNLGSMWAAEGGYETISKQVFPRLLHRRLLLEFDGARSGGFEPLSDVRDDAHVVLGLVSTKTRELESSVDLCDKVQEASRYIDRDRLALSTQCGFASRVGGNPLTWNIQAQKLALVTQTARQLWPD